MNWLVMPDMDADYMSKEIYNKLTKARKMWKLWENSVWKKLAPGTLQINLARFWRSARLLNRKNLFNSSLVMIRHAVSYLETFWLGTAKEKFLALRKQWWDCVKIMIAKLETFRCNQAFPTCENFDFLSMCHCHIILTATTRLIIIITIILSIISFIIIIISVMVCVGLPASKSGSRWRDGFDLAPQLCFEDLLKILIIIIVNIHNIIIMININDPLRS